MLVRVGRLHEILPVKGEGDAAALIGKGQLAVFVGIDKCGDLVELLAGNGSFYGLFFGGRCGGAGGVGNGYGEGLVVFFILRCRLPAGGEGHRHCKGYRCISYLHFCHLFEPGVLFYS